MSRRSLSGSVVSRPEGREEGGCKRTEAVLSFDSSKAELIASTKVRFALGSGPGRFFAVLSLASSCMSKGTRHGTREKPMNGKGSRGFFAQ